MAKVGVREQLRKMAAQYEENCQNDENCKTANAICDDIWNWTTAAALSEGCMPNDEAKAQWTVHYRSLFYYALAVKGKTFDDKSRDDLRLKAAVLGCSAASFAKKRGDTTISRQDIHYAFFEVDCPPHVDPKSHFGPLRDWCN